MSSRIKDPIVLFEEYYDVMTSNEADIVSEYETYKNTLAMHALFMHQFGCDIVCKCCKTFINIEFYNCKYFLSFIL